jgi:tRNA 2-thiocytidine biosynthesis protein TtcA
MSLNFEHPLAIKIRKSVVECIAQYDLITAGDRVMVCCSGGKDSTILLALLTEIQRRAPFDFSIHPVILDQKQPGFSVDAFEDFVFKNLQLKLTVVERDTYSVVIEKSGDRTFCALCSRMRRAILYDHAVEQAYTKVALGHHRDDVNQTLLLNLFYSGKLSSMPPMLRSDDGRNLLIRPLSFVSEKDLQTLATDWAFPVIPCNLCGSQEGMKRQRVKRLIFDLETEIPHIAVSMLAAQQNVRKSQLLDQQLWDFEALKTPPSF